MILATNIVKFVSGFETLRLHFLYCVQNYNLASFSLSLLFNDMTKVLEKAIQLMCDELLECNIYIMGDAGILVPLQQMVDKQKKMPSFLQKV